MSLLPLFRFLAAGAIVMVAVVPLQSADPFILPERNGRLVAVTFDDLPAARQSFEQKLLDDPGRFRGHTAKVLRRLKKLRVPIAGFVNGGFQPASWNRRDGRRLLEVWTKSGALLANHTFGHEDFHLVESEAFFASIQRGQEYLDQMLGEQPASNRFFRPPHLHRGRSPARHTALRSYLVEHGYRVAPITIDIQDWVFAEVYGWAVSQQDEVRAAETVKAYREYLEAAIEHFALLTASVMGREVPHIALLHANALNYDHIDDVIAAFRGQGFDFIDMQSALRDPAYGELPEQSGSWVREWQAERGLPFADAPHPQAFLGSLYDEYLAGR